MFVQQILSHVKLSQVPKQADMHYLSPHKQSVMPQVSLQNDLTPTHSSTPRMFFPLTLFYWQANISEALWIIRRSECVNKSMKERSTDEVTTQHPKR